jgi:inner membrane transporter RhtA
MPPLFDRSERYVQQVHVDLDGSAGQTERMRSLSSTSARSGVALATGSMLTVQLGVAASVGVFDRVGPLGAAWLRLVWAGVILAVLVRPDLRRMGRQTVLTASVLGAVTAAMTILFMEAVARIPLGTTSALEFLGPLGVAVARTGGRRLLVWPALAAVGVLLLTQPWQGTVNVAGVAFALGAAACWASYILLTQRVGDAVTGLSGLAVSLLVAGVVATVVAGPATLPRLTLQTVVIGLGLAILLPLVPFTMEMLALRRLTAAAFGTLMSLEPAIALVVGTIFLSQVATLVQVAGIAFVVAAGVGAERTGARATEDPRVLEASGQATSMASTRSA